LFVAFFCYKIQMRIQIYSAQRPAKKDKTKIIKIIKEK